MSMQTLILLIAIGLLAGMLSGLVGIGGGIIIVPSLVFFLGFSQKLAQGTSLGVLLLPVGILAVWQFYKAGYVDVKSIWIISGAFLIGGFFGSKIALALPQDTVKKIFGVFLLLIALKMIFLDKEVKANKETAALEQLSSKHASAD